MNLTRKLRNSSNGTLTSDRLMDTCTAIDDPGVSDYGTRLHMQPLFHLILGLLQAEMSTFSALSFQELVLKKIMIDMNALVMIFV